MAREIAEFSPNVPAQVALAYGVGKNIETNFGERVMYTLADGRIMFLDLATAKKIDDLGVRANQPFFICKHRDGKRGSPVEWRVWLSPDLLPGEQADGTFVVPAEPAASVRAPAAVTVPFQAPQGVPHNNGNGNRNGGQGPGAGGRGNGSGHTAPAPAIDKQNGWPQLLAQTNALVDVYAAALNYASEKHGNQIKADDVRSILLSAFINQTKNGGPHVA